MLKRILLAGSAALVAPALGQSINVAISPDGTAPSSSYGGAGRPGVWNSITAQHGLAVFGILDVHGNETGLRIRQIGGTTPLSLNDPGTSGDHELLLDHAMLTFNPLLETCIYVDFLEPGTYELIIYAWMPGQPGIRAYTSCDQEPGFPHHIVGGAWTGAHEEFVTYSRHICNVGPSGQLLCHSGVVPGDNPALGAAMNGFQLRKLPAFHAGDMNCDGVLSVADIGPFVLALTAPATYEASFPNCNIDHADMNDDGAVSVSDIGSFVSLLTSG